MKPLHNHHFIYLSTLLLEFFYVNLQKNRTPEMSKLLIVGTVAFDAIETPFGKTDKILGGAGTYIGLAASQFNVDSAIVSVVGEDFPQAYLDMLASKKLMSQALK